MQNKVRKPTCENKEVQIIKKNKQIFFNLNGSGEDECNFKERLKAQTGIQGCELMLIGNSFQI